MIDPVDDPVLRDLRVEHVTRADGRYLLYYSWPAGGEADAPRDEVPSSASRPDATAPNPTSDADV